MNITLKGTNLDLTDALKKYVDDKFSPLIRFKRHLTLARVELERMKRHHRGEVFRAEVTADAPHAVFRAESTATDIYSAVDLVVPKLVVQLEKFKEKYISKARSTRRKLRHLEEEGLIAAEDN